MRKFAKRLMRRLVRPRATRIVARPLDLRLAQLPLATRWCAVAFREAN